MKNIIIALIAIVSLSACTSLQDKSVAFAGNITAMKIETAGGGNTGTLMPNLMFGHASTAFADAPPLKEGEKSQTVVAYSKTNSFLGNIFGIDSGSVAFTYIAGSDENPEQTKANLQEISKVVGGEVKEEK